MTKEEYLRKVAEMQTDISAIKQEGREESKTCNDCIHKAVCYRYSYVLPKNYAEKCGDFEPSRKGHSELKALVDKHRMYRLAYDEMSEFERDVLELAEMENEE